MNIVQFWHSDTIPVEVQQLIATWVSQNPEHEHHLFNSDSAKNFMLSYFGSDLALAFDQITLPAMRCDVFRVAYLLINGGLYVDAGFTCFQPIKDWQIDEHRMTLMRKWHGGVCNGLICAPAGHPWLQELWQRIELVLRNRQDGDIWSLTGPLLFIQIEEKEAQLDDFDNRYCLPGHNDQARSIAVLDQAASAPLFTPCNSLKNRSRAHWSKLQKVVPLFEAREFKQTTKAVYHSLDKDIKIYLAHSQSTAHLTRAEYESLSAGQNETVAIELTDNFLSQQSNSPQIKQQIEQTLIALQKSSCKSIAIFFDLTKSMSEPHYDKGKATLALNAISLLCEYFQSSSILYCVDDQSILTATHLRDSAHLSKSVREAAITSLKTAPAFDFNLLDEGFRFYFSASNLQPFVIQDNNEVQNTNDLTRAEIEDIQHHFAESNLNFVEKYPHLNSVFIEPLPIDIAA